MIVRESFISSFRSFHYISNVFPYDSRFSFTRFSLDLARARKLKRAATKELGAKRPLRRRTLGGEVAAVERKREGREWGVATPGVAGVEPARQHIIESNVSCAAAIVTVIVVVVVTVFLRADFQKKRQRAENLGGRIPLRRLGANSVPLVKFVSPLTFALAFAVPPSPSIESTPELPVVETIAASRKCARTATRHGRLERAG